MNNDCLSVVQQFILAKTVLELDCRNNKDKSSKRNVKPNDLIFYAFSWHLIFWGHQPQTYHDFRISRIQKMRGTALPFQ